MTGSLLDVQWGISIEKKGETQPLFEQVHGNHILQYSSTPKLPISGTALPQADGAFSLAPQSEVYVYTADCFPILLFTDQPYGPIAALHAGWRGLKQRIVRKGLALFESYPTVHAVVGPAIGSCCFSVREDFVTDWESSGLKPHQYLIKRNSLLFFDLLKFVLESELKDLPKDQIHLEPFRCTACSAPQLPSFRRNKTANPRLRTWIRKLK